MPTIWGRCVIRRDFEENGRGAITRCGFRWTYRCAGCERGAHYARIDGVRWSRHDCRVMRDRTSALDIDEYRTLKTFHERTDPAAALVRALWETEFHQWTVHTERSLLLFIKLSTSNARRVFNLSRGVPGKQSRGVCAPFNLCVTDGERRKQTDLNTDSYACRLVVHWYRNVDWAGRHRRLGNGRLLVWLEPINATPSRQENPGNRGTGMRNELTNNARPENPAGPVEYRISGNTIHESAVASFHTLRRSAYMEV
ncbi:unnamed protein product, partial [Iphiclides podalirius]